MTRDALLAALAATCVVLGAWEAIGALDSPAALSGLNVILGPLRRAEREGRAATAVERRKLALLGAVVLLGAGWLVSGPITGVALAASGPALVSRVLVARRRRYAAGIARGAPALARSLADALAAGHSVHGAIVAAAQGGGVPGPAGVELRRAAEALALGDSAGEVLDRLRERARAGSIDTIVAAIAVQQRAGGALSALLRENADAADETVRLGADARAATAQARFTGVLVCGLPAGTAVLAELADPGYVEGILSAPLSAWLLGLAMALQVGAFAVIRRLGRVR